MMSSLDDVITQKMQFRVEEYIIVRPYEAVGDAFAHIQLNRQMTGQRDEISQCIYWLVSIGTCVRELRRDGMRLIHCKAQLTLPNLCDTLMFQMMCVRICQRALLRPFLEAH